MADILHRIGVNNLSPEDVYEAITTLGGLSKWWASDTTGSVAIGGVIQFRFANGGIDVDVTELDQDRRVRWTVVDGPEEWIGTVINWDLTQADDYTIVLFSHTGWREPVEFMYHCSTKWAIFLMSLKSLLETGVGNPDPHDIPISDWH
jgi:uncharacterized protein YndB with AHSA1/START domain